MSSPETSRGGCPDIGGMDIPASPESQLTGLALWQYRQEQAIIDQEIARFERTANDTQAAQQPASSHGAGLFVSTPERIIE